MDVWGCCHTGRAYTDRNPVARDPNMTTDTPSEKEIVRNYAMILPVRLNLNEDVLVVANSVFCSGQPTLWCDVRSFGGGRRYYVGGTTRGYTTNKAGCPGTFVHAVVGAYQSNQTVKLQPRVPCEECIL